MKETIKNQINNYEELIKDLLGKSISDINYYELDYGTPTWNEGEYHSLDFGLEIMTSDDEKYYFIWGREFAQFDVKFNKGIILQEFNSENTFKKYNVIDNSYWQRLIGNRILEIKTNWSYSSFKGRKEKYYYPQDISIEFENQRELIISALEILEGKPLWMKDHISVFFDREVFESLIKE